MLPTHGLLRSRVHRQQSRFESSVLVSENVFECCFSELDTTLDIQSICDMGRSCMRVLKKYFTLPGDIKKEMLSREGEN